jgi:cytochrome c553
MELYRTLKEYGYLQPWARNLINAATQRGELPPIFTQFCFVCGDHAEHYHHVDYRRPLEVFPVCARCHSRWHAPMREQYPCPPPGHAKDYREIAQYRPKQKPRHNLERDAEALADRRKLGQQFSRQYMTRELDWTEYRWNKAHKLLTSRDGKGSPVRSV